MYYHGLVTQMLRKVSTHLVPALLLIFELDASATLLLKLTHTKPMTTNDPPHHITGDSQLRSDTLPDTQCPLAVSSSLLPPVPLTTSTQPQYQGQASHRQQQQ